MIPDSFKQELLARIDIVDVVDPRVPLKKAGTNWKACCPFHAEKTPSFVVSPVRQTYHCFGCGAHGNAIGFLMEYGGLGYIDALRELADMAGMKLPEFAPEGDAGRPRATPDLYELMSRAAAFYKESLKNSPRAIEYLKGRGLTGAIAARFSMGYAPDGWQNLQRVFADYDAQALVDCGLVIVSDSGRRYDRFRDRVMFPIADQRGQIIGFGGRVIDAGEPKYLNSPETPLFEKGRELYGLGQAREAIRRSGRIMVVEGYMDVVALAQHGVEGAVATLGTATTPTHVLKMLRQVDRIVYCFDGDDAGRKAAWHALEITLGSIPDGKSASFLFLPREHDPDSFVREHGAQTFLQLADRAEPLSEYLLRELGRRNNLATAEGRAKVVTDARPLLEKMTAPVLQLQLIRGIAELAEIPPDDAARLLGVRAGAIAAPLVRRSDARPGFRPQSRAQPVQIRGAPLRDKLERDVLRAVLAHPELAAEVPIELVLPGEPAGEALLAVIDYLSEQGADVPIAVLMEYLESTPHGRVIAPIARELVRETPDSEAARAELRGALRQLELRLVEEESKALEAKSPLSEPEQRRLLELVRRGSDLKEALRGVL